MSGPIVLRLKPFLEAQTLGIEGDVKTMWNADVSTEVEAARAQFDGLRRQGYLAFRVTGKDGTKGEQMREFDPDAERIIFAPPMQGG